LRGALFDVVLQEDRRRQFLEALRAVPLDQLWRQVLGQVGHRRRDVLGQLPHHDDRGLSCLFEHPHPTDPMRFPIKRPSAIGLPSTLLNFPNLLNSRLTAVSTERLPTSRLRPQTRTRPRGPGTCGKGKGWNALASLWVLGGRRGVGDDALCQFLRRRPRSGFMPGSVRGRCIRIGNCGTGGRVDPFAS
jgi:hypothetical protein